MRQVDTTLKISHSSVESHDLTENSVPTNEIVREKTHAFVAEEKTQDPCYNTYLLDSSTIYYTPSLTQWSSLDMDSLFASYQPAPRVFRKSLFSSHDLQTTSIHPVAHRGSLMNGWFFMFFIITIVITNLFNNNHRFRLSDMFSSAIDVRAMDRTLRSSNMNRAIDLVPATLIYSIPMGLLLFYIARNILYPLPFCHPVFNCLALSAGVFVALLLRDSVIGFLGNILNSDATSLLYVQSTHIYQYIGGLILTPFALLLFCNNVNTSLICHISLLVAITVIVIRVIRGLYLILKNSNNNSLYLLYYISFFEIVPILILGKLIF